MPPLIDAEAVYVAWNDCCFRDVETYVDEHDVRRPHRIHKIVNATGIFGDMQFHGERFERRKPEIHNWIDALPERFFAARAPTADSAPTMVSFLEMCHDKNGVQWGEHADMDRLMMLGHAARRIYFVVNRPLWAGLPGGMPLLFMTRRGTKERE